MDLTDRVLKSVTTDIYQSPVRVYRGLDVAPFEIVREGFSGPKGVVTRLAAGRRGG